MKSAGILLPALLLMMMVVSCSGGSSPASPDVTPDLTSDHSSRTVSGGGERINWGMWDIHIDRESGVAEVVPERGPNFMANVVNFLHPPISPVNLLTVQIDGGQSDLVNGYIVCDVTIRHPFPGTKFAGFDVMGIVLDSYDSTTFESDPDISVSLQPGTLIQNPDGYTRWWNQQEFTTTGTLLGYIEGPLANHTFDAMNTLNGFKYFCDELESEQEFDLTPELRGFFSSEDPGVNTRRYELQFPTDPNLKFYFKYAISASWVAPYEDAEAPFVQDDYPISANMAEAYRINVFDNGSTAYFENESTYGGDLDLFVDVWDWQFDGSLSNVQDEYLEITIESPTLFPDPIIIDLVDASVDVTNTTKISVPVYIADVTPTDIVNQHLLVTVKSANIDTYEPQIPGLTGYDYPSGPLAAYGIFEATITSIGPQNTAPVADASATEPTSGDAPLDVNFDPSLSYDTDGTIVLYEWDFDGDGTYDWSGPNPDVVMHTYEEGTHHPVLRVTDNDDATDTDEIEIQAGCYSSPGWRTFRHDNMRTGRTSTFGPVTNNVKFTWDECAGSAIMSGITIDSQNRALFRANDGNVYCVDTDGMTAWSYYVGGTWDYTTPSIGNDESVYVGGTTGVLYKFDSEGNYEWEQNYGLGAIGGGIAIQEDDTIVFTTHGGWLVKTFPDGSVDWTFSTGSTMPDGPSIGNDGTIYVANHGGRVYAVDQDGGQVWMTQVGYNEMSSTPSLGPNAMYIGDWGGNVYCLEYDDGGIKWQTFLSSASISSFAAVDCSGHIYIGSRDDNLYCLDQETGDVIWNYLTCGDIGTMSPVLDGNGHVYTGSYCGWFYCLDAITGDLVWDYDTGIGGSTAMYCKSPALADDGTIITGSNAGILFAWQDE